MVYFGEASQTSGKHIAGILDFQATINGYLLIKLNLFLYLKVSIFSSINYQSFLISILVQIKKMFIMSVMYPSSTLHLGPRRPTRSLSNKVKLNKFRTENISRDSMKTRKVVREIYISGYGGHMGCFYQTFIKKNVMDSCQEIYATRLSLEAVQCHYLDARIAQTINLYNIYLLNKQLVVLYLLYYIVLISKQKLIDN